MPTTTTFSTVIDAFLDRLNTDLVGASAYETWPGPEASREMVILGDVAWQEYMIPTLKSGRRQRQEEYMIVLEVWVIGKAGTTPSNPAASRIRAAELLAAVEDLLAVDVTTGLTHEVIQQCQASITSAGVRQFEKGWGYRIVGELTVKARLT